ncbi:type IV toxin-antitoxin system AbiEi family antitoxin domain-containing protein [Pseudonocardia cypriaca]|uniref:Uncharacterized protein n=1 Tax=Pseudonocardia cypriaca TaxID=882449 RepID=A0A543FXS4_9PSEU|nr:hypothetical protein [Pseudonocardia cypriaca]TQM38579.1 hypothetical protein FB388_5823 [Pseudonocardia cypriaca]
MQSEIYLRWRLRAAGYGDHEVRRMLRDGSLHPIRRGAYVAGPSEDPAVGHALLVRAALAELSPDAVVSHVSAAVLHGLRVWGIPLDRVIVTRTRRRSGARRGSRVHVHCAPMEPDEIVLVDGLPVTSVPRTIVDVARTVGFEQAVVVADAALEAGLVDEGALAVALARWSRWPGLPAARRAIGFAARGSGSVGESRSRVAIAEAGLPAPILQWEVRRSDGTFVGRVDFGWPRQRTVGEFDGRVKYGKLLRPGQDPADVVYEEKRREDALRAEDLAVVRWTWPDLTHFAPVAARLRSRLT